MGKREPVKQDLNLAQREPKHREGKKVSLAAVLLAAGIGLFCKLAVLNPLNRVAALEDQAVRTQQMVSQMREKNQDYDAVLEEYRQMTRAHEAMGGVDAEECLHLLENYLLHDAKISAFTAADGLLSVQLSGVSLQKISEIYRSLMADNLVSSVQVYTANTEEGSEQDVHATMTIQLVTESEKEASAS